MQPSGAFPPPIFQFFRQDQLARAACDGPGSTKNDCASPSLGACGDAAKRPARGTNVCRPGGRRRGGGIRNVVDRDVCIDRLGTDHEGNLINACGRRPKQRPSAERRSARSAHKGLIFAPSNTTCLVRMRAWARQGASADALPHSPITDRPDDTRRSQGRGQGLPSPSRHLAARCSGGICRGKLKSDGTVYGSEISDGMRGSCP